MSRERFERALEPIVEFIATLDPAAPDAASALATRFPVNDPLLRELAELFDEGVSEGWLCDRDGGEHVRYSRVRKASGDEISIDAVHMSGPGPGHLHPNGEFDLCFSVSGEPAFDGTQAPWHVYPPNSWHVPTVTGGTMNILYFLPGGAIEFGPRPESA